MSDRIPQFLKKKDNLYGNVRSFLDREKKNTQEKRF